LTSENSFTRGERVRLMGISVIHMEGLTGAKLEIVPAAQGVAKKAPLVRRILTELAGGALDLPHDGELVEFPGIDSLRSLGPVIAVTHIDSARAVVVGKFAENFFSIYTVEFENGTRLCGLHQRADGVLDGFRCV
jgi:hypothetical protein